jgi:CDGSH-type Zn-finger protein
MPTSITPMPDGPYVVKGDFEIVKADGTKVEAKETAYLCRCGKSSNKPFCDGTHKKEGFKSA